jgi:4-alpha-glucanotransferase
MTSRLQQDLQALHALAATLGVQTSYTDGLGRPVAVGPETLVRVCATLGAELTHLAEASDALEEVRHRRSVELIPPTLVAWDGALANVAVASDGPVHAELRLEGGGSLALETDGSTVWAGHALPWGYHTLIVEADAQNARSTVIAAPSRAWRRSESGCSWGLGTQLAALRSSRSRTFGDLRDLEVFCRWVGQRGGDLVTVLPLLPTFNRPPSEPSPYSPVSRLFWSELILDLGHGAPPVNTPDSLDVTTADAEVRAVLEALSAPDLGSPDAELQRYARFRGAQARLGRNWSAWPARARAGHLEPTDVDAAEERFHLVAQTMARQQLEALRQRLDKDGMRLGLDLAVGVHPDGYDPWSRQGVFAEGMSVGAPPDRGFPSGQDWGFSPVLPGASRQEGHEYLAASVAHQASLSGVLRIDHIMALSRLYWIPHGAGLHEGTYVSYPAEELFAIVTLESHRHRCEVVGENLGVVPQEIDMGMQRHEIWGMFLAEFEAMAETPRPPVEEQVALIGTHDTPTLAGWIGGTDIDERLRCGLLADADVPAERRARSEAVTRLAETLGCDVGDLEGLLTELLQWLGRSPSPLVVPWLEDLWLEAELVNVPGTGSSERPNWRRPMARSLDDVMADPGLAALLRRLDEARATRRAQQG